jgi:flavorubredoxin
VQNPDVPIRALESELVAPDTYVTRQLVGKETDPFRVFFNSMVITGSEPILIDAGSAIVSEMWLEQTFSVVDPADVRWIFISHDDHDHTGNLPALLDLAPQATLVTTHFMVERLLSEMVLPLDRMRWVNDGDRFTAGDRELVAVTPPIFDSPTTRGLYDTKTGVYWGVDSFAAPVTDDVRDISELDPGFWRERFLSFNRMVSPWHTLVDPVRWEKHLDRIRQLAPTVVASGHGPAVRGSQIDSALTLLSELPHLPAADLLGQADLDAILAEVAAAAHAEGAVVAA